MKFTEKFKSKATEAKKKVEKFYNEHETAIVVTGIICSTVAATVAGVKADKWLKNYTEKVCGKDTYKPLRLFDRNGKEFHLFSWDSGAAGDVMDLMFFPEEQIGWSDEINWGEL